MLFNSYIFLLAFLPLTLAAYHLLQRYDCSRTAIYVLVAASIFYYAWWDLTHGAIILGLLFCDYCIARLIEGASDAKPRARRYLILGIAINLVALGYFKYTNFLVDNVNAFWGSSITISHIVLPIGISFFTFQKIAFLVDIFQGKVKQFTWINYFLFILFFPQLIAGPIVHHSELMPQFDKKRTMRSRVWAMGITFLAIGLAKKVLIADPVSHYASPAFAHAAIAAITPVAAWTAALAYTAQLYFDFSAYSDMAIGIGLLFGIRLPINFDSPYKSISIIEFWRRWHITLSRFLRDYLYIPLGGNRGGSVSRYRNLFITMLLGGFWHGAGWQFVIWGGLHGLYLCINHFWQYLFPIAARKDSLLITMCYRGLTLLAVIVAWVFFRAANADTAVRMLQSMFLLAEPGQSVSVEPSFSGLLIAAVALVTALIAPNTQQITGYRGPKGSYGAHVPLAASGTNILCWKPSLGWAVTCGMLLACSLMLFSRVSEFIYFQF